MESNFSIRLSDKQKQEPAPHPKIFAQLNQKCFLSQTVTEILYKPITCMLPKDQSK